MRTLVLEGYCFQSFITTLANTYEHWNGKIKGTISNEEWKRQLRLFETWLMKEYSIECVRQGGSLRSAIVHNELKYVEWLMRFG